jgi:hypothetical protein
MIDYLLLTISFFATVLAIKGQTWNDSKKGIKKITNIGLVIILLAVSALIFSIFKTSRDNFNSIVDSQKIDSMRITITNSNDTILQLKSIVIISYDTLISTNALINQAYDTINKLKGKIETYEAILEEIHNESERQPQIVFAEYVNIRGYGWSAPNRIYPGSIIKFYLFRCAIELRYNDRVIIIPPSINEPVEIPIIGPSGIGYHWELRISEINELLRRPSDYEYSNYGCDGKVYIYSSPRIRSTDWSSQEERN